MFISPHKIFVPANSDGDSIITSRLDIDVYKLIMGQFIWAHGYADVPVTFRFKLRTKGVKLGRVIPEAELRAQLDALQALQYSETELSQIRGMTVTKFDGTIHPLFSVEFVEELKRRSLSDYQLRYTADGDIDLSFSGSWLSSMNWETAGMAIISELYYWNLWKQSDISPSRFSAFYSEMHQRLVSDCDALMQYPGLTFSQFGHRRRHSRFWEMHVQEVFDELLPTQCLAPSNVWLAFQCGKNNPKGTNAHELPMVWATLADNSDEWIRRSPFDLAEKWAAYYPELAILLPDTFRTSAFLQEAPDEIARQYFGVRIDSKKEEQAIPEIINWYRTKGEDPMRKVVIPSDGLTPARMIDLWKGFSEKVGSLSFGFGSMATNNINDILSSETGFHTLSMVIKAVEANGRPTVKLSDNPNKHTGIDQNEIDRYDRLFARGGETARQTIV